MTDAGDEFYRHALATLQGAERAEAAMRRRLAEPAGTIRFTAAVAAMQFAMSEMVFNFLIRYPKVQSLPMQRPN
jgi:DNA-binding transcriptional LysR family regulator